MAKSNHVTHEDAQKMFVDLSQADRDTVVARATTEGLSPFTILQVRGAPDTWNPRMRARFEKQGLENRAKIDREKEGSGSSI